MQPISKPISNKEGFIGKPGMPKRHPIRAAPPCTHLSTKYPWDLVKKPHSQKVPPLDVLHHKSLGE